MILDARFEIPKIEDSISNFQVLLNILRNIELKTPQHVTETKILTSDGQAISTDISGQGGDGCHPPPLINPFHAGGGAESAPESFPP